MSSWRDNVLENLCLIYQESGPSNVGRIMTYLTLVYKASDFCETGDASINSDYFDHDEALEAAVDKKVSSETSFKKTIPLFRARIYQSDFRLDFFHYLICNKI
jgi:hypothetical protein